MKTIIQKCKQLAYLLRHNTEYHFDEHGWREIGDLITNHGYTQEMLDDIVATNNKQRYEYSEDKTKIRARQGHSVQVDVKLKEFISTISKYVTCPTDSVEMMLASSDSICQLVDTCSSY